MILLNDFKRQWQETGRQTLEAVEAVGASGWYVLGNEVREFETALAARWPQKHCIGVASGLDAIEICLRVLGCKRGDKVLTTPVTAFATTLAILKIGAVPVFVDCDRYGLINLDACESALSTDRSIRFFVPVHLYGHSLDMGRLQELRDRFESLIVEDCAQSILASYRGIPTGTVGQMAATSFYPTKNLGALGDGGAILTGEEELASHARRLRNYGESGKYRHDEVGYNSRLDELQAAILRRTHLPRLPLWTERRKAIARMYCEGIRQERVRVPGAPDGSDSCWHLFPVWVDPDDKTAFMAHLRERGIMTAEHYPVPAFEQKAIGPSPHEIAGDCVNARRLCRSEVSLPIHPYMTDEEVRTVIDACNGPGK